MTKDTQHIIFAFDLDNTLVKTDVANNNSYKEAIRIVTGSELQINQDRRFTKEDLCSSLPYLSKEDYAKIVNLKNQLFSKYLKYSVLNNELFSMLRVLYLNGNRTILLTNSCRNRAKMVCSYYNLNQYFHNQYFSEDYDINKYQFLCENFDLETVVLFENETESINEAIQNGLIKDNIISIKF